MKHENITREEISAFLKDLHKKLMHGSTEEIRSLFCCPHYAGCLNHCGTWMCPEDLVEIRKHLDPHERVISDNFVFHEICKDPARVNVKIHAECRGYNKLTSQKFHAYSLHRLLLEKKEGHLKIILCEELVHHALDGTKPLEFHKMCHKDKDSECGHPESKHMHGKDQHKSHR